MKRINRAPTRRDGEGTSFVAAVKDVTIERARASVQEFVATNRTRHRQMMASAEASRRGTRKRALAPAVAGLVGLAGMFQLVSANVLAVNFTTGNKTFKLYSNYLDAQQAAGYLNTSSQKDGTNVGVAELGIHYAKLSGLCAIAQEKISILGATLTDYSLMITAGEAIPDNYTTITPAASSINVGGTTITTVGGTGPTAGSLAGASATNAVSADNLYVNADLLAGFGNKISGLNLGQSADTVAASAGLDGNNDGTANDFPGTAGPTAGNFGLYANYLNVAALDGSTYGINLAGAITLPKLQIKVVPGNKTQADCS
ncbi:MAG TPA: DUF6230 family protein [Nocardioides sp.]|uniref:DUF6230 family protein n=1 Tax=Nocardioides sp. TaxID=35761 RepID=UPI002ED99859